MSSRESWQLIATDSDHLLALSSKFIPTSSKSRRPYTPHRAQASSLPSTSTITLPQPLVSDFLALGCKITVAQDLSRTYLDFAVGLKQKYEAELQHVNHACFSFNIAIGNPTLGLQSRLHHLYESQYLSVMKAWARDAISITQRRYMCANLKGGLYSLRPTLNSWSQTIPMRSRKIEEKVLNPSAQSSDTTQSDYLDLPSRPHRLHLLSSFEQSVSEIKIEDEDISGKESPSYAFPSPYSRPLQTNKTSCLKTLSRGFRRNLHRASSQVNIDNLSKTFDDLSVSKSTTQPYDKDSDRSSDHSGSLLTSQRSSATPLPVVLRPATFNPLLPLPASPASSNSTPRTLASPCISSAVRSRKVAAMPRRNQSTVGVITFTQSTTTPSKLPSSSSLHCPTTPPQTMETSDHSDIAVTLLSTPISIPCRKKIAALPKRCAPTSTISSSLAPTPLAPFAPLSIANVSSLSKSLSPPRFSPPRFRSNISRTPSLTSLTSNSGSSSPSSDGLDTPPSTPPPFITNFPSPVSPSSLTSKSYAPNPASGMSPSSVFQFSSPKKLFETISPSQCTPSFSFSAGIKREDESFSFTFGR
uniref:B2 mating type protein n=1 Tax=Heterobasidion annosum TaxID=13563 RepID=S5RTW9_HETAN|nr:b2 mating type protein [Heterobasidion annosum]